MTILREIGVIARALDAMANIEFRHVDLAKGQYPYLVRIVENPGIIQEELSDLLKVDRSTVARSVKNLERKGLIVRRSAEGNLKNKELFATEAGEKVYPLIIAEHSYSEQKALTGFSKEEAELLEGMLAKVRENITSDWEPVKKGQKRKYTEVTT
ncbi:MarR family winged helix-turn-helix transcriptional regulator [Streptococcus massiliensis]|uniref:Multiple antibiotic resistance operon transcription repressor MarR n=1 Tax=Streptococcus massiliensis TaxID=313439 RepID=A0A380KWX9_9STRE|nr:MarR family transcriptional regulator [Streptococcus massiliensis]SUN76155.1 multiple antibiotic resistance operon transcription repressor MarR [Streptococcus massiliensis]